MNQILTQGIVLTRTNFQEADRILTLLTRDFGKVRVLAKGVRKSKSKLAGGVELLSVSEIGFIRGRGELGTLITSRLISHYGLIVKDLERTRVAYEFLKRINKLTEEDAGPEYFELLQQAMMALDDRALDLPLIQLWFDVSLLQISGHMINLRTDAAGNKLEQQTAYNFDQDTMSFETHPDGAYDAGHIKLLRLVAKHRPGQLAKVEGIDGYISPLNRLISTIRKNTFHI